MTRKVVVAVMWVVVVALHVIVQEAGSAAALGLAGSVTIAGTGNLS